MKTLKMKNNDFKRFIEFCNANGLKPSRYYSLVLYMQSIEALKS